MLDLSLPGSRVNENREVELDLVEHLLVFCMVDSA